MHCSITGYLVVVSFTFAKYRYTGSPLMSQYAGLILGKSVRESLDCLPPQGKN